MRWGGSEGKRYKKKRIFWSMILRFEKGGKENPDLLGDKSIKTSLHGQASINFKKNISKRKGVEVEKKGLWILTG